MAWLIHSAKGTQWTKHKYIKKVGGKYYYPSYKTPVTVNTFGDDRNYYKIGGKYYHTDDINSSMAKMEAADEYNDTLRKNKSDYNFYNALDQLKNDNPVQIAANRAARRVKKAKADIEAKIKYENTVANSEKHRKNKENKRSVADKFTLSALNASASVNRAVKKGKKKVQSLLKKFKR